MTNETKPSAGAVAAAEEWIGADLERREERLAALSEIIDRLAVKPVEQERDEARQTCAELVTDGNAVTLAAGLLRMEQERDRYRNLAEQYAKTLGAKI